MNINKENYEFVFIDYIDGKLSAHDIADLMIFFAENPKLDIETSNIEKVILDPKTITFYDKDSLKRTENIIEGSLDDKCIAYLENDLPEKERVEFEQFINSDIEKKKELFNYKNTILTPNNTIVYPNKTKLKKSLVLNIRRAQFISYISSAAAVVLFIISFNTYGQRATNPDYSKVKYSYLDKSMIEKVKEVIESLNDGFIPDLNNNIRLY